MVVREIELRSSDGDPVADVVGRQVLLRHQAPRGEQSLPATGQRYPYLEEAGDLFEGHEVGGGPRSAFGDVTGGVRDHILAAAIRERRRRIPPARAVHR